jgi:hypothetical protein
MLSDLYPQGRSKVRRPSGVARSAEINDLRMRNAKRLDTDEVLDEQLGAQPYDAEAGTSGNALHRGAGPSVRRSSEGAALRPL